MRVLLAEDEPEMVSALRAALIRHDMIVDRAPSLAEAKATLAEGVHGAVLLDRQLPDGDGLSLIPILRASGNAVPVLVLTARGDLVDRVAGLDNGADDYLGKPFAFEESAGAIARALLRRPAYVQSDIVRWPGFRSTSAVQRGERRGKPLEMPRRETSGARGAGAAHGPHGAALLPDGSWPGPG